MLEIGVGVLVGQVWGWNWDRGQFGVQDVVWDELGLESRLGRVPVGIVGVDAEVGF